MNPRTQKNDLLYQPQIQTSAHHENMGKKAEKTNTLNKSYKKII
jgi:hypothetical protein